ncbi:MAG: hypothetical protein ACI39E_03980, partial [Acutalibacteraceae bacterium]
MKRAITGILALVMIFTMALTGCTANEKRQEALDKHTAIATAFNEVATLINENADSLDVTVISRYQQMSELLNTYTDILQGGGEISDEKYDEMIAWFDEVEDWIQD